ncbi:MAG: hypothetical protein EON59_18435 [Alphaproteobacteria bacterium]|jgi:hypothetical protein|nr:MAG: hypothetical protein EON59_18435 [Alphaproteobacteria bacterium]
MTLAGLLLLGLPAGLVPCDAQHAEYRLRGARGVIAGFERQRFQVNFASDLFFWVRTQDGRRWWFSMNAPNGSGLQYLTPDVDATTITESDREAEPAPPTEEVAQIDIDLFDAEFDVITSLPQASDRAPAHIFTRNLAALLWYNPGAAAGGDANAHAVDIPTAMFDLVGCRSR